MPPLWSLPFILVMLGPAVAFANDAVPHAPTGYATLLFQTVLVLAGVCGLALVSLRFGLERFASPRGGDDRMRVIARLPVEPRRSVLIVRIGPRHLILGSSEAGFQPLGELDEDEARAFEKTTDERTRSFADVLAGIRSTVSRETRPGEER